MNLLQIGASGVRGSIRLVFRLPKVILTFFKLHKKHSNIKKELEKDKKRQKNRHSIKIPYKNPSLRFHCFSLFTWFNLLNWFDLFSLYD